MVVRKYHWKLGRTIQGPRGTIPHFAELQRQNGHSSRSGRHNIKLKSISWDQNFMEFAMLCIRLAWDSSLFSFLITPFWNGACILYLLHHCILCSPSKFTCWSPNSQCASIGCQDFRRKLSQGNSAIIRRDMKVYLSLCHGRTLQEDAALQTREKPSMLTPWSLTFQLLKNEE